MARTIAHRELRNNSSAILRATIRGRFSEIESVTSELSSAEILDELRAER